MLKLHVTCQYTDKLEMRVVPLFQLHPDQRPMLLTPANRRRAELVTMAGLQRANAYLQWLGAKANASKGAAIPQEQVVQLHVVERPTTRLRFEQQRETGVLFELDLADLAGQMLNKHHQYPDGAVLYTGTMYAPIKDRDAPGKGFTHKMGDIVTVSSPKFGSIVSRMKSAYDCPPWTFGASHLMRNLAKRGLI